MRSHLLLALTSILSLAACFEEKALPTDTAGDVADGPDTDVDPDPDSDADSDADSDPDPGSDSGTDTGGTAGDTTVCGDGSAPYTSIQDAIDEADDGAIITLCPGTWREVLYIGSALTLEGQGAGETIIDGGGAGTVVEVLGRGEVTLRDLTLTGGGGDPGGALLSNGADVALESVEVVENDATEATIYLEDGSLTITDTTVARNVAVMVDGVMTQDADLTVTRTTFAENSADWDPDAAYVVLHLGSGDLEMYNSLFYGHAHMGYAIFSNADSVFIANTVFDLDQLIAAVGTGDYFGTAYTAITLQNDIITTEAADVKGVVGTPRGSLDLEYTLFDGVTYATCVGSCTESPSGTGCLEAAPRFEDAEAGDYHLDALSPAVDAGNPASAWNDADGSRNDLGIYGGPYGRE